MRDALTDSNSGKYQIRLNVIHVTSAYDVIFGDFVYNLLPFGSLLEGESQRNPFFIFSQRIGVAGRPSAIFKFEKLKTLAVLRGFFIATKVITISSVLLSSPWSHLRKPPIAPQWRQGICKMHWIWHHHR